LAETNSELLETLKTLSSDPSRVFALYSQLYEASLLVPVRAGSENDLGCADFLTYPTVDQLRELPIFTRREYLLENLPDDAVLIRVNGDLLWRRLLEIVGLDNCQAAVDPGQKHGIRLRRDMILGMIMMHDQGGDVAL
jgi:hypothetical protein